mmetsp:Transcript_2640/g.4860  ORF Transcript_2640/g.4860 Transcript_2640/m.4860 type:complete len:108 (+) Transcript_2640:595-918(+)
MVLQPVGHQSSRTGFVLSAYVELGMRMMRSVIVSFNVGTPSTNNVFSPGFDDAHAVAATSVQWEGASLRLKQRQHIVQLCASALQVGLHGQCCQETPSPKIMLYLGK